MLLEVKNLNVSFDTPRGKINAVRDLNFDLELGKSLAIVGESGSGKSQSVFSIMHLLAKNASVSGEVLFESRDILKLSDKEFKRISFKDISIVFQDPMTSLNPYMKIGPQLSEIVINHEKVSKADALKRSLFMLDALKIPEAKKRMNVYPHELSGGMRQRIMIAMALICNPKLLICDEPTTALDVTIQAQILKLLSELKKEFNMSMILISHDLGVVADSCDDVLVMYAGQMMEYGDIYSIFEHPSHPYTKALLQTMPHLDLEDKELSIIHGNPPDLSNLPKGCSFAPRCQMATSKCLNNPDIVNFKFEGKDRARRCFAPINLVQGYDFARS